MATPQPGLLIVSFPKTTQKEDLMRTHRRWFRSRSVSLKSSPSSWKTGVVERMACAEIVYGCSLRLRRLSRQPMQSAPSPAATNPGLLNREQSEKDAALERLREGFRE
jgi:hypothetical protein